MKAQEANLQEHRTATGVLRVQLCTTLHCTLYLTADGVSCCALLVLLLLLLLLLFLLLLQLLTVAARCLCS